MHIQTKDKFYIGLIMLFNIGVLCNRIPLSVKSLHKTDRNEILTEILSITLLFSFVFCLS